MAELTLEGLLDTAQGLCPRCGAEPGQRHRTAPPPRARGGAAVCTGCGKPPPPRAPLYGGGGFRRPDGSWAVISEPCEHLCPSCSSTRMAALEAPSLAALNARAEATP